jgi:F-type H+-transporting ATPase subunit b
MAKKLPWVLTLLAVLALAHPVWADSGEAQPQLVSFDVGSAIWVLISFGLVLIILSKTAWKTVLESLQAREDRIRNNIQAAEDARAKAETALKEHAAKLAGAEEQVRQMLVKATLDAEKIAANIKTQAQADGEAEREKTRKEIEAAKRDAIRQVYEQTADLATSVAAKIIGRNLNAQDQQDLVNQTLGQLETLEQH